MTTIVGPTTPIDWTAVPAAASSGSQGSSSARTIQRGDVRVRVIEYSESFLADHWCARGHVLFVLEGVVSLSLRNGETCTVTAGQSLIIGEDEQNPHQVSSARGAKVFIVD